MGRGWAGTCLGDAQMLGGLVWHLPKKNTQDRLRKFLELQLGQLRDLLGVHGLGVLAIFGFEQKRETRMNKSRRYCSTMQNQKFSLPTPRGYRKSTASGQFTVRELSTGMSPWCGAWPRSCPCNFLPICLSQQLLPSLPICPSAIFRETRSKMGDTCGPQPPVFQLLGYSE